jgi:hypothetical protein
MSLEAFLLVNLERSLSILVKLLGLARSHNVVGRSDLTEVVCYSLLASLTYIHWSCDICLPRLPCTLESANYRRRVHIVITYLATNIHGL